MTKKVLTAHKKIYLISYVSGDYDRDELGAVNTFRTEGALAGVLKLKQAAGDNLLGRHEVHLGVPQMHTVPGYWT